MKISDSKFLALYIISIPFLPLFAQSPENNKIKNCGFEELTGKTLPLHWNIKECVNSDQEFSICNDKNLLRNGANCLKIERYNEKAELIPLGQSLNMEFTAGETIRFGGYIKSLEDFGGETCFVLSVVDGEKKMSITSKPVSGKVSEWVLSEGEYRFKFNGKLRYAGITFRPVSSYIDKKTKEKKQARGIFLYDDVFVVKTTEK
ncbi:MAG: hypothetical protein A2017_08040 [Lentisphaerae bacterium GWF2_44_16]|nr:MAG: hypothetical protein A2017_08040 [Lentisphaerae bacterium GWF2_44_16]